MIVIQRAENFKEERTEGVRRLCTYGDSFFSESPAKVESLVSICRLAIEPSSKTQNLVPKNTECLGYVLDGKMNYRNALGPGSKVIEKNQAYILSSGSGESLQETVEQVSEPTEMLQIQLHSQKDETTADFKVAPFDLMAEENQLVPIASITGDDGALLIRQNCFVYGARLAAKRNTIDILPPGRQGLIYVISGTLKVSRSTITEGDSAVIIDQEEVKFRAIEDCHFIYLDLPPTARRPS